MQSDLDAMRYSLALSLVSVYNMYARDDAQRLQAILQKKKLSAKTIAQYIKKSESLFSLDTNKSFHHYMQFVSRSFVIQLYELCKHSSAFNTIKEQDWFVFLANLRHAFAHGVNGNWRITYYGNKQIHYTRQHDLKIFSLHPYRDNSPIQSAQYGGLLTIWDLTYYVEKFVIEKNVRTKNIHRSKVFA
jgi:DNA-binding transcriptional MerR regulator